MSSLLSAGLPATRYAHRWADHALGIIDQAEPLDKADTVTTDDGVEHLSGDMSWTTLPLPTGPPIAFTYGGRPAAELLPGWETTLHAPEPRPNGAIARRKEYRDPETGLAVTLEMTTFPDAPFAEWVVYLRNDGTADTPIIEDLQALDMRWGEPQNIWPGDKPVLYRSQGSQAMLEDFLYRRDLLLAPSRMRWAAGNGRSSNHWLPFFNLQTGNTGFIAAIGWSAQWAAEINAELEQPLRITAGQELTHLVLHPGESIRTPRIALGFWSGEALDGHNSLRRFIIDHHLPTPGGKPLVPPICAAAWGGMRTADHLAAIDTYREHGCQYDYYWVDAGWFGDGKEYLPFEIGSDWWKQVGTWHANTVAHPDGLRPISNAAHAAGMGFLLWFEPERAMTGSQLPTEHPEWFLGEQGEGASLLFNLGLPEARAYLTDLISARISEYGIDCFRLDYNLFEPLPYLRGADAPDRRGMAEIRYVEGLYAFLDELLSRHPHLLIDNCSSGGRRIDLEMTGRAIPLWRSDYQCNATHHPTGSQVHVSGLSYWVPLHGSTGRFRPGDTYSFRSALSAATAFVAGGVGAANGEELVTDYPWDWHLRMMAHHRRARPLYAGDYYPLTDCTISHANWSAYQLHRADLDEGMLLAFRRDTSGIREVEFRLRGLTPGATYRLENMDSGEIEEVRADQLQSDGIRVTLLQPRESRLIFYRRIG